MARSARAKKMGLAISSTVFWPFSIRPSNVYFFLESPIKTHYLKSGILNSLFVYQYKENKNGVWLTANRN